MRVLRLLTLCLLASCRPAHYRAVIDANVRTYCAARWYEAQARFACRYDEDSGCTSGESLCDVAFPNHTGARLACTEYGCTETR